MEKTEINQVLKTCLDAFQPVAAGRNIRLDFDSSDVQRVVDLPMDEVLVPVLTYVLRMLYVLPAGKSLVVYTTTREEEEPNTCWLRIEFRFDNLSFNPNLLVRPDNNRLKVDFTEPARPIAYIEWAVGAVRRETGDSATRPAGILPEGKILHAPSDFYLNQKRLVQRFEEFGGSAFVRDKLGSSNTRGDADFLERVINCIHQNLDAQDFDSAALEKQLCLSKTQLFRKLKQATGYSTANYIRRVRLLKASELLEKTALPIRDIAEKVGFKELSYFSRCFQSAFHASPSDWRKAQK